MFDGGIKNRLRKYDTMKMTSKFKFNSFKEKKLHNIDTLHTNFLETSGHNYINTTSNDELDTYGGLYLNTYDSNKEHQQITSTEHKQPLKQSSQSCNTSDKNKKGKVTIIQPSKERPSKRVEADKSKVNVRVPDVNNSNINNSYKIEREVELSIVSSKGGRKPQTQFNMVTRDSIKDQSQIALTQRDVKNSLRESGIHINN